MKLPKRFGPEWWAFYGAAFARDFASTQDLSGFDRAVELRSSSSELAAAIADQALEGFADAVEGGCVRGVKRVTR